MRLLGEFGPTFFGALYDLRVPIAVAGLVAATALVVVVGRRGWFAAARRNPARSGVLLAVALAVGAPTTWYLASPIWIRTSLVEVSPTPAPTDPSDPAPTVVRETPSAPPTSRPAPTTEPTPEVTPFAVATVASGKFRGTDDFHFGRGTASILEVEPGRFHLRLDDFSVRNGPDLYVYLSTEADDYSADALEAGVLKATDGSFGYELPPGTDPSLFRSAIIWCKQFSHLFAVASF
jgi:Electron transfer DM13